MLNNYTRTLKMNPSFVNFVFLFFRVKKSI